VRVTLIYLEFPEGVLPLRNTGNGSEVKQNPALSWKTQHTFTCAQ